MATLFQCRGPVPLYLIPQTLADEIRKYGDSILKVQVERTSGHTYLLKFHLDIRGERP